MIRNSQLSKPPYPSIGEICSLLASAFSTKSADGPTRKKLDRLARDGDFDWRLRPQIIESLLVNPLNKLDRNFGCFVEQFVDHLLDQHIELLSKVSLDAMSRAEAAPLLLERYAAAAAAFLVRLKEQFGGPDLGDFFHKTAEPVDVVFTWAERIFGFQIAANVFPEEKSKRDEIGRWRRGATIPDFDRSIVPLRRALLQKRPARQSDISLFAIWLVTARSLSWLVREAQKAKLGPLLDYIRRDVLMNCPTRDIGMELSNANHKAGVRMPEVAEFALTLFTNRLNRTSAKTRDDRSIARKEISQLEVLLKKHDSHGGAHYMLEWCEARWHILSNNEDGALAFYERATNMALYRSGENQRAILKEALCLAAHLGKKPITKRLTHRALALGMFPGIVRASLESFDVISEREIKEFAGRFFLIFPIPARFPALASDTHSTTCSNL